MDQQALKNLVVEQLEINYKTNGSKTLTTKQAEIAIDLANETNVGASNQLKVLDHTFSSGNNAHPGHFKGEGSNGHIHIGHGKNGHIPVNN